MRQIANALGSALYAADGLVLPSTKVILMTAGMCVVLDNNRLLILQIMCGHSMSHRLTQNVHATC